MSNNALNTITLQQMYILLHILLQKCDDVRDTGEEIEKNRIFILTVLTVM